MRHIRSGPDAAFAFGVFVVAALACGGGTRETATVRDAPSVASVTAAELFDAYDRNEIAADQQYKGRIITVAGIVSDIGKDILGDPYLTLDAGQNRLMSVQAMFAKGDEGQLAKMGKGQVVRVKCKCDGKFGNVILRHCSFQ